VNADAEKWLVPSNWQKFRSSGGNEVPQRDPTPAGAVEAAVVVDDRATLGSPRVVTRAPMP